MSTGSAAAPQDAAAAFAQYDRNGSGAIEVDELKALLRDLGLLEGRGAADARAFVAAQFAQADRKSRDNALDPAEFAAYYAKITAPRLLDVLAAELPGELGQLCAVFAAFATFGAARGGAPAAAELDGPRWTKLCKETGLVGRGLTTTDCDLAFAKCKERAARKISFEQFLDALDLVAAKKGQPITEVVRQVVATQGPALHSTTKAEAVRFHDDPSTYTGVAARRASLSSTGSGPAARRRSSVGGGTPASRLAAPRANSRNSTPRPSLGAEGCTPGVQSRDSLREAFNAFASVGMGSSPSPGKAGPEMDSRQFVKLCRDAGIIDRRLTATSVDIAFAKAKAPGTRKLSFSQFLSALERLAAERGVPKEALHELVASCAGPTLNSAMTPVEVDSESGRLLSRAASGSPAGSSSSLHGAAAAVAAAVEAAGSPHQVEEQEQEEVVESLAVGVDKLSLGGNVFHITASTAAPDPRE